MSEKERPQLIIDYEANTDKLVRLGDVVDQFKGKAVPAKAEPGEFAVINLSDMTPNGIAYDDLKTFSEERRKLLRFLLEDGDVLIASKGTVQKVAVFEDQGKREVVASSNITVSSIMLQKPYLRINKASKLRFVGFFSLFSCIMEVVNMFLGGHYDYQHYRFITTCCNNH